MQRNHISGIGKRVDIHFNSHFAEHFGDGVCHGNLGFAFAAYNKFKAYSAAAAVKAKTVAVFFGKTEVVKQKV